MWGSRGIQRIIGAAAGRSFWLWISLGLRTRCQGEHGIAAPLVGGRRLPTQRISRLSSRARGLLSSSPKFPCAASPGGEISSAHGDWRAETQISHKDKSSALSPTSCCSRCDSRVWDWDNSGGTIHPHCPKLTQEKGSKDSQGPGCGGSGGRNCDSPGCCTLGKSGDNCWRLAHREQQAGLGTDPV